MLPEIGASELILIGIVALIVVGPKDLPILMRRLGQFVARMRGMASEFRASFDEMARQSELDELRREVEAMRRSQVFDDVRSGLSPEPLKATAQDIEAALSQSPTPYHPPMGAQHAALQEAQRREAGQGADDAADPGPAPGADAAAAESRDVTGVASGGGDVQAGRAGGRPEILP